MSMFLCEWKQGLNPMMKDKAIKTLIICVSRISISINCLQKLCKSVKALFKNRTWTRTQDMRKSRLPKKCTRSKNQSSRLKILRFVSCHMKDNIEVIDFHVKSRSVQGLVFVKITVEKCTTKYYFENGKVVIKMTIVSLQSLLVLNVSACLRI